jgi:hypothetical protein
MALMARILPESIIDRKNAGIERLWQGVALFVNPQQIAAKTRDDP